MSFSFFALISILPPALPASPAAPPALPSRVLSSTRCRSSRRSAGCPPESPILLFLPNFPWKGHWGEIQWFRNNKIRGFRSIPYAPGCCPLPPHGLHPFQRIDLESALQVIFSRILYTFSVMKCRCLTWLAKSTYTFTL